MNQIRCGASGIVIDYPACGGDTDLELGDTPMLPDSICKSLMAENESPVSPRRFKKLNPTIRHIEVARRAVGA